MLDGVVVNPGLDDKWIWKVASASGSSVNSATKFYGSGTL
jgi:hypothetical protein